MNLNFTFKSVAYYFAYKFTDTFTDCDWKSTVEAGLLMGSLRSESTVTVDSRPRHISLQSP